MRVIDAIQHWADRHGYLAAFGPASILRQVDGRIDDFDAAGAFAPGFAETQLQGFRGAGAACGGGTGTIAVVAVPRPAWAVRFETKSGAVDAVVPPTYVEYRPLFEQIRSEIVEAAGGAVGVRTLAVPLKSLAAAVGLASYGRNNLAYVQGHGSYVQLCGYLIDAPCERVAIEVTFERMLERCATCRACVKSCPTGAIDADRFLLRADRCYTLASESLHPIPDGMVPPSPDCLIGCLKCQEVCPVNRGLLDRRPAAIRFSQEETDALVSPAEIQPGALLDRINEKFASLAITEGVPVLRRNLRQLVELAP